MGLLISIFGPDGAGKSTQASILRSYLRTQRLSAKNVWIKSYHTFAYILSRIYARLSPYSAIFNSAGVIVRINAIKNSSLSRWIWAWIEFISLLPVILIRVQLPLLMGRVVITERYLVDSVVAVAYSLNEPNFTSSFIAGLMLRLVPRNSLLIYLDSNYEETRRRRGTTAEPEEFIEFQRLIYNVLCRSLGAFRVNTSQHSIVETARIIRSHFDLMYNS